jgi:hypothetical protein
MRNLIEEARTCHGPHTTHGKFIQELADRLEEVEADRDEWMADSATAWDECENRRLLQVAAEAKLAKAVEALEVFKDFDDLPLEAKRPDVFEIMVRQKQLSAIAELKGEKDE